MKCGDRLQRIRTDFAKTDTRTTSMQLHMMTTFYRYTGDKRFLEAAKAPAEALLKTQRADGSWSKYLSKPNDPAGFVEHAIMAVADYYDVTKDERLLPVITKALQWYLPKDGAESKGMTSDLPLLMSGLDVAYRATKDPKYVRCAKNVYALLDRSQNRSPSDIGRGDFWASWGVNETEKSAPYGRPPQFLYQTRPLGPSTLLAYGTMAMRCIAEASNWKMPESKATHRK
jgi:rhamnogalacturonyl hydrolase YesR